MKKLLCAFGLVIASAAGAQAAEIGHYAGGLPNIRDLVVPEPGFYAMVYNYNYHTRRVNGPDGHEVDSVTLGPNGELTLGIKPDVDIYVVAPAFIWVTERKFLGAHYGALLMPTFSNNSVSASLSAETGRGADPETSQFGVGDMYLQPLWLGWPLEHWDLALAWGFYAPTGKYDLDRVAFPGFGPVKLEAADNIGFGFWTNQFQAASAWYPWPDKRTAVTLALTYEINSRKEGFHVTAGDNLSMNWGISQYLPLSSDMQWLVEIGPAGYDTWQVTADSGSDRTNGKLDQVHGVGGQIGVTSLPWMGVLNFHYFYEVESESRFQGQVFGLSIAKKF